MTWNGSYFAHSLEGATEDRWQALSDHLREVQRLAGQFGNQFTWGQELASVSGLLHDLGKYTLPFQSRIRGAPTKTDHSTWGAKVAIARYGPAGLAMAYAIAGHHAGLANGEGEGRRTCLAERLTSELPELEAAWRTEISAPEKIEFPPKGFKPSSRDKGLFQLSLLVRMIFSCLVDADFLDTENFYLKAAGQAPSRPLQGERPSLEALRDRLDQHLQGFLADRDISHVNAVRSDILRHVRGQAVQPPGLFSLTVPTGGGKTLASLAFALDHAIQHRQRRVIFVIPFTSIVEQNAAVFREALGDLGDAAVLEHHSAFNDDLAHSKEAKDKIRLAMENWDAPIIVTTAVQFFESLFADRPSRCRKLHNIANSVVILDEAQTMPLKLLRPCVATIDELARNYRSTMVLCTATQPALHAFDDALQDVRELAPDPPRLFEKLQRVTVKHIGILDDESLLARLRAREQVLCIVNNRRHARALHEGLQDLPGSHHLTTLMCAAHRSEVLAEVRAALRQKQPCRLVSTSLIEAGVDLSFPTVYRAEAGLDSVAQAAGRCNRHGQWAAEDSEVLIFANANEDWKPPPELQQFAAVAREVLRNHPGDTLEPAAIESYFERLYKQKGGLELDAHGLLTMLRNARMQSLPMDTLAEKFRFIDSVQMPVIVPFDDDARALVRELEYAEGAQHLARKLQRYIVQLPRQGYDALYKAGAIRAVQPTRWGEQFMLLVNESLYRKTVGLTWDNPTHLEDNIW